MDIPNVIYQLRKYCPILKSVAGAAEYNAVVERGNMIMPSAYVISLADEATENDSPNSLFQWITESVSIMVALNNDTDQLGQTAATITADDVRQALFSALLNWHAEPQKTTWSIEYKGKHLHSQDRNRIWYNYIFSQKIPISESDGFQMHGVPLTEVVMTDTYSNANLIFGANIVSPPIVT